MARSVTRVLGLVLLLASSIVSVHAEPEPTIPWAKSLDAAFKSGKADNKIVLICVNAPDVEDAKQPSLSHQLREVLYKNSLVVEKAAEFVCVLVSLEAEEELKKIRKLFRIKEEDAVGAPRHIFAHPRHIEGEKPLVDVQWWRYGVDEAGARALIDRMKWAQNAFRVKEAMPELLEDTPEARAAWIEKLVRFVRDADEPYRREALRLLEKHDKDGDCLRPLVPLLARPEGPVISRLLDVMRVAVIPEALPALHAFLVDESPRIRGFAAVSLEYIGSASSVEPLLDRIKREKDPGVANDMYRALGRCGAGDSSVRKKLLRQAAPVKGDDFERFGAVLGLAYFEKDEKAARALERHLTRLGLPMQVGSKARSVLRALTVWCLGEIGDFKSGRFLQKKFLDKLAGKRGNRVEAVMTFYGAVARKCEGHEGLEEEIDKGVESYRWRGRLGNLVRESRQGRNMKHFRPKGEWGNPSTHD